MVRVKYSASKEELFFILESFKKLSNIIKNTLGIEFILCFYIIFIVFSESYKTTVTLPIIKIEMLSPQFLFLAPLTLLIIHFYLHIHLAELRTKLDFVLETDSKSNNTLKKYIISPWLFTIYLDAKFFNSRLPLLVVNSTFIIIIKSLVNYLVPITIFVIWYNFIAQQLLISLIPAISIVAAVYISIHSKSYKNTFVLNFFISFISLFVFIFTLSSVPVLRSMFFFDQIWEFLLDFQSKVANIYQFVLILPLGFFSIIGLTIDGLFFAPNNTEKKDYKIRRARRFSFIIKLAELDNSGGNTFKKIFFNTTYFFATISGHGLQIGYGMSIFVGLCLFILACCLYLLLFLINT